MEALKSIAELARLLDTAIVDGWSAYIKLHDELKTFEGQEIIGDKVDALNKVLGELQTLYADLHHGLHFINFRNQFALNAMQSHQAFIDKLKEAGAKESHDEPKAEAA